MKQISKTRKGSKVIKRYDKAKTPYQRLLEIDEISETLKITIKRQYESLNPAELHRQIIKLQEQLMDMVIYKTEDTRINRKKYHKRDNKWYAYV